MSHRVLLLGCGAQGRAVLHDLLQGDDAVQVVVADREQSTCTVERRYAGARVEANVVDAADEAAIAMLMRQADVVVEALPGPFALPMARLAAHCGVSLVSSMYLRDPQELDAGKIAATERAIREIDEAARSKGIVILPEFGLDPGLDLILGARALGDLDAVEEFHSYGAGLPGPAARDNALSYRFSWSPIGVMRSYRRPARVITGGVEAQIDPTALFEPGRHHLVEVPEIGVPLECYPNGDAVHYAEVFGLRATVREMTRYTGRYVGHCAFWHVMVRSGFLESVPVEVNGMTVAPIDFTAAMLSSQPQFQYGEEDEDLTWIRVDVRGRRGGQRVRVVYDVVDRRDFASGLTSMQRTVGFTLARGARLILEGSLGRPGLRSPVDVPYDLVFPALERHGIRVTRRELPAVAPESDA
ncbi:MAG: saccharopine dehydrogenase C-terminal domain-containing protein [Gemmatimonadaceae bacterium]|nr:saccharopine dehydrogenase C-terminal domain-containing protein [Gemmatimonadaceae bacterium]